MSTISGTTLTFGDSSTQTTAYYSSNGTSGWVRLGTGIIIQWGTSGTITYSANTSSVSLPAVTFPIAFTNLWQIIASNSANNPGAALYYPRTLNLGSVSTTGFTARSGYPNNGTYGFTSGMRWIAVGN
jgi:hypothetical protein